MSGVVNVSDLLDGHVALDWSVLIISASTAMSRTFRFLVRSFVKEHLGHPMPSGGVK
jgi:hypothetical protein